MTTVAPQLPPSSMEPTMPDGLVARAVPCIDDVTEQITEKIEQMSMLEKEGEKKKNTKMVYSVSPSDFVTLQSNRSSALAKKTNTTSKFLRGGPALFSDLINKDAISEKDKPSDAKDTKEKESSDKTDDSKKDEDKAETKTDKADKEDQKKEVEASDDGEPKDTDLLSRGPVRNSHPYPGAAHHPYQYGGPYGTAAQSTVHDFSAFSGYGGGYECGATWVDSPETLGCMSLTSSPESILSDQGYNSSASPPHKIDSPQKADSPSFADNHLPLTEISRLLDTQALPDTLADFILAYSRQYTENGSPANSSAKSCDGTSIRPGSADSGVDSPMSARSAPYHSPEVPTGGNSGPTTPSFTAARLSPRGKAGEPTAKQRLHAIIKDTELAAGFHWAVTCAQLAPGAMQFKDEDGDSLLHIVVAHVDLGKIYALTEQMKKMTDCGRPFDEANKYNETPLFGAVMQRQSEVVAYFIEMGANPNVQTSRGDRDTALHYAASRGMSEIVDQLLLHPGIRLNEHNGRGLTPLHCAIKNHGVVDERTQLPINNMGVIEALLKAGADPTITDATNGRTIVHMAVEKMNVELIDILKSNVDDDQFTELANTVDFNSESPVDLLELPSSQLHNKNTRQVIYIRLLASGAISGKSQSNPGSQAQSPFTDANN